MFKICTLLPKCFAPSLIANRTTKVITTVFAVGPHFFKVFTPFKIACGSMYLLIYLEINCKHKKRDANLRASLFTVLFSCNFMLSLLKNIFI